jgi:uncharacterized protein
MTKLFWFAVLLTFLAIPAARADQPGPSFNCAVATGTAEQMICRNPQLAAADRALANIYNNTEYQAGIDPKALRREEDAWLLTRNKCTTDACIAAAYATRKAQLLDESLRAASPAAYDETQPYPAPADALAIAQRQIGQNCNAVGYGGVLASSFQQIAGFLPIITAQDTVWPVAIGPARFAFLLNTASAACIIADVVALPPPAIADSFLECFPDDAATLGLNPVGLGMRKSGVAGNVAYWDIQNQKLQRIPLGVLGLDKSGMRCQQPETGE